MAHHVDAAQNATEDVRVTDITAHELDTIPPRGSFPAGVRLRQQGVEQDGGVARVPDDLGDV
ncbi:hypothetical protein Aglo01_35510 [Actinokineospora globicatena]|nr:hypothetical protein Aglo01_35510 [Actinokineospora globicatena]GLW86521.1 hypothetical protein Aglo02_41600 [Actinokineospora globicatena]